MAFEAITNELLIAEYDGTARSGKGTIVGHLTTQYASATSDETGADFRVVAKFLLEDDSIHPDMTPPEVTTVVGGIEQSEMDEIVGQRLDVIEKYGRESLYDDSVKLLVPKVAMVEGVRQAVRTNFQDRVRAVRDDPRYNVLLIDGRRLADVVQPVDGVRVALRTFVTCMATEAARRESDHQRETGRVITQAEYEQAYQDELIAVETRNQLDASRSDLAGNQADANAIDYWEDGAVIHADQTSTDYIRHLRRGVGTVAANTDRQILFDTTPFRNYPNPKKAMLDAATIMIEEAMPEGLLKPA